MIHHAACSRSLRYGTPSSSAWPGALGVPSPFTYIFSRGRHPETARHLRGTAPYRIGNVDYPAGRHRSILRERSEHMSHLYRGRGIVAFLKGQTGPQRKKDARQLNARYDRRQAGTP